MGNITAANAVIMLGVGTVFPVPVQIQGFSADDIFSVDEIDNAEIQMGVDGNLSSGFIYVPIPWKITLQADSLSNQIFDLVNTTERALASKLQWQGLVTLPAINTSFIMANGVMNKFKPMPDAGKTLKPRTFTVTWESITPVPVG